MNLAEFPMLTILTLVPLLSGIVLIGFDSEQKKLARGLAFTASVIALALGVLTWLNFDPSSPDIQFEQRHSWIPTLGIEYFVGIDGLGLLLVLLTAIVMPMAILASWKIEERVPLYFSLVLFLEAGLIGTFTALNFFHWFIFWELSLIPAFFLIKFWGGADRSFAATQFFVYTMVGSVTMLLGFLALYYATGTFDFLELAEAAGDGGLATKLAAKISWPGLSAEGLSLLVFAAIFLGFAVKVPLIPFHIWLPTAYVEAPTPTTMLLTGLMSKMGVYGFLRVLLPLFPEEMRAVLNPLLWLAVITIIFSACAAFAQKDLKRILAYSSINHLGYCLLGVFAAATLTGIDGNWATEKAAALNGVVLQMFNHGLTASALFAFVGFLEQRSGGARSLDDFGGLRKAAPVFCGLMGIVLFASLGLPGLNGFVGEFLIFKGAFSLATWATGLSTLGLLVTAIFLLTLLQKVFNGPLNQKWSAIPDLSWGERVVVVPAVGLMFVLGIYPQLAIGPINATVQRMVEQLKF